MKTKQNMATHRPSSTSPSASMVDHETDEKKDSTQYNFNLMCLFNIPSSPEAARVGIIRNLSYFRLYYTLFVWEILCVTLVPKQKVSLIDLVAMIFVSFLYLVLLYSMQNSVVSYKAIDRRLVLAVLAIVTMVDFILTSSAIHLFVALVVTMPIVLLYGVLWEEDDPFAAEEAFAASDLEVDLLLTDDNKEVDLV